MMNKKYEAPRLCLEQFDVERGFEVSLPDFSGSTQLSEWEEGVNIESNY